MLIAKLLTSCPQIEYTSGIALLTVYIIGVFRTHTGTIVRVRRLPTAMTNKVYLVESEDGAKSIVRLYRGSPDNCSESDPARLLIDRKAETLWSQRLSEAGFGPKVLGVYDFGRVEEYLSDTYPMSARAMRGLEFSARIAKALAELHFVCSGSALGEPILWARLLKWQKLASLAVGGKLELERLFGPLLESALVDRIKDVILKRSRVLSVVLAHNDLQHGNLLVGKDRIRIIDYDYIGPNYAAFDIANHFCEWCFDFDADQSESYRMDSDKFPTEEEAFRFLQEYLLASCGVASDSTLQQWYHDVLLFRAVSSLQWSLWGIVKAIGQAADFSGFNYLGYAIERRNDFLDKMEQEFI